MPRSTDATKEMQKLAETAVTAARERFNCPLDYSEASLARLELLLAQAFLRFSKLAKEDALRDKNVDRTARVWGSYLGEVIRRRWGGEWQIVDGNYELLVRGRNVAAIEFVFERITSRPNYGAVEYYDYTISMHNLKSTRESSRIAVFWSGFAREHPSAAARLQATGFMIVAMAAVVLISLLMAIVFGNTGTKESTVDEVDAFVMCERFVKDNLKAPSTASFPHYSSSFAQNLGGGSFRIHAYVDAENSFGAKVRTDFVCVVKYTGNDNWQLESLSID